MRKLGIEGVNRKRNLKSLLEELCQRDVESTESKIYQAIDRQRSNYKVHSQSITAPSTQHLPQRPSSLLQALSPGHPFRDKENLSHRPFQRSHTQLATGIPPNCKKMNALQRSGAVNSERLQKKSQTVKQQVEKTLTLAAKLPSIAVSNRSSISERGWPAVGSGPICSSQCINLAVIEEETVLPLNGFGMTFKKKLQKHRSWAHASTAQ